MFGSVDTEVPLTCGRTGTGTTGVYGHFRNVRLSYRPSPAEHECAEKVLLFAKRQVRWELGHNARYLEQLGAAILSGRPDLSDPYQVFLKNIYLAATSLENLSRIPDHMPTDAVTATGLGSCYVTSRYLIIHCEDDTNGYRPVRDQDGWMQYELDGQGNLTTTHLRLPLDGGLSFQGGTMYGNVFFEDEGGGTWDMRTYTPTPGKWPPDEVEHHEQVHSQQWATHGWGFTDAYLSAGATAIGEAWWFNLWNSGAKRADGCFNVFERDAHWHYGGYGRDPGWGWQTCGAQLAHVP